MKGYLGETVVEQKDTQYKEYKPQDWSMYFIERYGGIDGAHHKDWGLDQVCRILKGTAIEIKIAKWDNGQIEHRINTGNPSQEYLDWVFEMCEGEDGPNTYSYDEGISP